MKNRILTLLFFLPVFIFGQLPKPDHIVIVMFQNKNYSDIVGSSKAPYINSLLADSSTAHFTQSYALTHPSQPNYLMLFSGSNQGVTTDNVPTNTPFHTCNLGASILASSKTFTGYSESMPSPGYLGNNTSLYYRKHNPWSDWQGSGENTLPAAVNQPFSSFPQDYSQLPALSIVVPNIINCMHDGTIEQGDTWLQNHFSSYVQWAKTHNSLLIVTFDEDGNGENNRILTLFNGPMVKHGQYANRITHYNLLRTLEDIYNLPACGASANSTAINYVWRSNTVGMKENTDIINSLVVLKNSYDKQLLVTITASEPIDGLNISLVDLLGKANQQRKLSLEAGENTLEFTTEGLPGGVYFINVTGKNIRYTKKIILD
jgi:hypothetical protein